MAETATAALNLTAGWWTTVLIRLSARGPVAESLRAPGARTTAQLAPWIKDTPELKVNLSLLVETFLQLLASGLGKLAFVWATVVLLGGFSTALGRMDFWFITAIVFIQVARIVGYNSGLEARFFVDLPGALYQNDISRAGKPSIKFVRLITMGPTLIALAPVFLATACILLSVIRLVGIGRHAYGRSASNGNMKPALILFYALVLTQGALFLLWFPVMVIRSRLARELSSLYLSEGSREQLMEKYINSIAGTCIEKGVATTINTNLVSFASELLLQSQHPDDHHSAVSVLHSLVIHNQRSHGTVEQICSSKRLVYKLVRMLPLEDLHAGTKEHIAKIVAKLACKLRLADIPGAAQCVSSLLDPHLMKTTAETGQNNDFHSVGMGSSSEIKPIFVHGLVILGELASDPENCREIYSTMDLVPKIIAPVSNGLQMVIEDDKTAFEIVWESLRVLAKLTRGTGESSRKFCRKLTTKNYGFRAAENILWILSNSRDQEMRKKAIEILSRLTLSKQTMRDFVVVLQRLLIVIDPQDRPLRPEAGKALSALVRSRGDEFRDKFPDIQQLVTIMGDHYDANSNENPVLMAEMFAKICAKSTEDEDRNLRSVASNAFSTVLKAIVTETETRMDRKFLASFLGLAVQIHDKNLVTEHDFSNAVRGLQMGNNIFAETLQRIIEVMNDSDDELCLAIMKSATKLVTWMMEINTDSFGQANIFQTLDEAVRSMVHLERYVVMTSGADEKEGYASLHTLVEKAKNKWVPQQQQQN